MDPYRLYPSFGVVFDFSFSWCCILVRKTDVGNGHKRTVL